MNRERKIMLNVVILVIALPIAGVSAAIINVPDDYRTIQAGIDAASSGDTVLVADGLYVENIIFPLGTDIIVKSENGPEVTTINGNHAGSVVTFNNGEWADWVLDGFTLKDGYAAEGGGIHSIDSSPTIINCTISDNTAYEGSGGGIYVGTTSDQKLLAPPPGGCGGLPTTTIKDSDISNNSAAANGGGISSNGSSLIVAGSTLSSNSALAFGGGIYYEGSDSDTLVLWAPNHSYIDLNSASDGGGLAIFNDFGSVGSVISGDDRDMNPQIIQDSGGTLHVVWESEEGLNGARVVVYASNDGTIWSPPYQLNGTSDTHNDRNPQIIADSNTLYAVWASEEDINTDFDIFLATNSGSGWSVPELVNTNGTTDSGGDLNPQIIKDSSGTLHAVWHSFENLFGSGTDYDIFRATNSGLGWSAPSLLNTNGTTDSGTDAYPQIIEDSSGTLHAVWHSSEDLDDEAGIDDDIFYASNTGTGWSAPSLLNTNGTTDTRNDWDPQIIEDSSGTLHAVWESQEDIDGAGTDFDIFCATNSGTGWSAPSLLNANGTTDSGDDYLPQIIEDSSGGVFHVVWESDEDLNGTAGTDYDIFYTYGSCGDWCRPTLLNPSVKLGIININFIGNHASNNGGAIYIEDSNTPFSNCIFSGNDAVNGGAIYIDNSNTSFSNCIFSGNNAVNVYGGTICCYESSSFFVNATGGLNKPATGSPISIANYAHSNTTLTNCILWGNPVPTGPQIYNDATSSATVSYSNVQGGYAGTGNIDDDPLFIDPNGPDRIPGTADDEAGYFHLRGHSPCINAGDPAVSSRGRVDVDGQPRVAYGRVDMGADEVFPVAGDSEPDGDVDLADFVAIFVHNWLLGVD
jgi:predicted outer membrane repeat protein